MIVGKRDVKKLVAKQKKIMTQNEIATILLRLCNYCCLWSAEGLQFTLDVDLMNQGIFLLSIRGQILSEFNLENCQETLWKISNLKFWAINLTCATYFNENKAKKLAIEFWLIYSVFNACFQKNLFEKTYGMQKRINLV